MPTIANPQTVRPAPATELLVVKYRAFQKNTLQAFVSFRLRSGIVINDNCYHIKGNSRWVAFPGRSYEMENGTKGWSPVIEIPDRETLRRFQHAAIEAIDAYLEAAE